MVKTNITKKKKYNKKIYNNKRTRKINKQSGGNIYDKISTIMKRIVDNPSFIQDVKLVVKDVIKEKIIPVGKQIKNETIEAIEITLGGPGAVVQKKSNTFLEEVCTQLKTRLQKKVVKTILEEIYEEFKKEDVYHPPSKNESSILKFRGKKSSTSDNIWSSAEIK